ncbi:small ribosomal subunit Rsm22 family protein, partial [Klebsiella pneumoniae]|uniref:small ribosomal subunit Rsm22 family protein n=1 Tax=Klebsiella pneumoniae TaxID=573 RepID=UPI003713B011
PGTATFAAAEAFSSLGDFSLIDANPSLRKLALALAQDLPVFGGLRYRAGDAGKMLTDAEKADLVIASYVIGELTEREQTD